jgi:hypothetical protein
VNTQQMVRGTLGAKSPDSNIHRIQERVPVASKGQGRLLSPRGKGRGKPARRNPSERWGEGPGTSQEGPGGGKNL